MDNLTKAYGIVVAIKDMDATMAGATICTAIDIVASKEGMNPIDYMIKLATLIHEYYETLGTYKEE